VTEAERARLTLELALELHAAEPHQTNWYGGATYSFGEKAYEAWADDLDELDYPADLNKPRPDEPEIYDAIRFGTLLENEILDPFSRKVDFQCADITENTRASYPIGHIANAKIPCVGDHPKDIIFLTADAFGVLPPVSRLTPEQAMYHFMSGYTAKIAGTEQGVDEPQATFSTCFGAAFIVRHPTVYAELLADKIKKHGSKVWLVNTGWAGGPYGTGSRIKLAYTRAIINAIHGGTLVTAPTAQDPVFGLELVTECPGVPSELLCPRRTWANPEAYDRKAWQLAELFKNNFAQFASGTKPQIVAAGPK
jgi:phosphoenolpyruvate carboxykinase (ATP)